MRLTYVQDPSHGWIAADLTLLIRLGLTGNLSPYSYREGSIVWLEEDCDAPMFITALRNAGISYEIADVHVQHTHIRDLPRWTGQ